MELEAVKADIDKRLISINEYSGGLERRITHLEESFARLAVLVEAIRQCVDTQTDIFKQL